MPLSTRSSPHRFPKATKSPLVSRPTVKAQTVSSKATTRSAAPPLLASPGSTRSLSAEGLTDDVMRRAHGRLRAAAERGFERGYYTAVRYVRPKRGAGAPRFRLAHTGELGRLHVLASGAQYSVAKYAIAPG